MCKSGVPMNEATDEVELAARELALAAPESERGELAELAAREGFDERRDRLLDALRALESLLRNAADAGENIALVHRRCQGMIENLERFSFPDERGVVYWYERSGRSLRLHATPIAVDAQIRENLVSDKFATIFTSATLLSQDEGAHFCRQMGLDGAEIAHWQSPYDYRSRALLYVPDGLPEPASPDFARAMVERALPVLRVTRGRAFLLFTSYRMLNEVAEILAALDEFPLLVQGQAPRHRLIQRFRETEHGVLLGTASFWEGVDVKGESLICVMIDKLPFASPSDPVTKARIRRLAEDGANPFHDYQLPQALIAFKQGAGRLIRDEADYGVLMVCDPRIRTRGYGHTFLSALPPMKRTTRLEAVREFLQRFQSVQANR